jgi:hypothetical protein
MSLSLATILIHTDGVSEAAKEALTAASEEREGSSLQQRMLESAARSLHRDFDLECRDALELVGLPSNDACNDARD